MKKKREKGYAVPLITVLQDVSLNVRMEKYPVGAETNAAFVKHVTTT